jgi:hypothetical protein
MTDKTVSKKDVGEQDPNKPTDLYAIGKSARDAEFFKYVQQREDAIFNSVNDLYKLVRSELNINNNSPPSLDQPSVKVDPDGYHDGAIASYNPMFNQIAVYKRGYKIYEEMKAAEAKGDTFMADSLRSYLDEVIGHELGHALTHNAYFESDPNYSYTSGLYRRKDDGLAELIGFYIAQKMNGKGTDNESIANAMLEVVRDKQEAFIEYDDKLRAQWPSMTDKEKAAKAKEIDLHATRSSYYDYAIVGFATALKANPNADLATIIKIALAETDKLAGMDKYVLNVKGAALELERIGLQRSAARLLRGGSAPDFDREAANELRLQDELSNEMLAAIKILLNQNGANTLKPAAAAKKPGSKKIPISLTFVEEVPR